MLKKQNIPSTIIYFNKSYDSKVEQQQYIINDYLHKLDNQQIIQNQINQQSKENQHSYKIWQRNPKPNSQNSINNNQVAINNPLKSLVSKNKKRFQWGGYDLDLSYITEKIIAMGFPSQNLESIYRNKMEDVESFLDKKHKGYYKVYNLCKEKTYSKQHFHGNVVQYPFEDHFPPHIQLIYFFCRDAKQWLLKDIKNVAVVHCKAGKGRTGTMISCLLIYIGFAVNSDESMKYYASKRTNDCKGVTIPSQVRYIKYFESLLHKGINLQKFFKLQKKVKITKIKVSPIPQIHVLGGCTPWISITNKHNVYKSKYSHQLITYKEQESFQLDIDLKFFIRGDMIICFFSKRKIGGSEQYMHICLNSLFVEKLTIIRGNQIDGVKNDPRYNKNTCVQIHFQMENNYTY